MKATMRNMTIILVNRLRRILNALRINGSGNVQVFRQDTQRQVNLVVILLSSCTRLVNHLLVILVHLTRRLSGLQVNRNANGVNLTTVLFRAIRIYIIMSVLTRLINVNRRRITSSGRVMRDTVRKNSLQVNNRSIPAPGITVNVNMSISNMNRINLRIKRRNRMATVRHAARPNTVSASSDLINLISNNSNAVNECFVLQVLIRTE